MVSPLVELSNHRSSRLNISVFQVLICFSYIAPYTCPRVCNISESAAESILRDGENGFFSTAISLSREAVCSGSTSALAYLGRYHTSHSGPGIVKRFINLFASIEYRSKLNSVAAEHGHLGNISLHCPSVKIITRKTLIK